MCQMDLCVLLFTPTLPMDDGENWYGLCFSPNPRHIPLIQLANYLPLATRDPSLTLNARPAVRQEHAPR